jgi:hypothetical protein
MASYRLLMLDHRMMTFCSREFACDGDEAAEAEAADLARTCRAVEVWCGARLVARVQYQSLPSWRSALGELAGREAATPAR